MVGAGDRTLTRAFVRETGLRFDEWRTWARVTAAVRLRWPPAVPVGRVAGDVGYATASAARRRLPPDHRHDPDRLLRRADPTEFHHAERRFMEQLPGGPDVIRRRSLAVPRRGRSGRRQLSTSGATSPTYTGSWFERLAATEQPHRFTEKDFVAVGTLGVEVPPSTAIWLLGDGAAAATALLEQTDPTLTLWDDAADLTRRGPGVAVVGPGPHQRLAVAPGRDGPHDHEQALAAKRPHLIPIQDSVATALSGGGRYAALLGGVAGAPHRRRRACRHRGGHVDPRRGAGRRPPLGARHPRHRPVAVRPVAASRAVRAVRPERMSSASS